MTKFLTFMALVVFAAPVLAAEAELPGNLIDDLMKKNGGEVLTSAVKTAESALPTRREEKNDAKKEEKKEAVKNIEATQPVFSNPATLSTVKNSEKNLWGRMAMSLI